MPSRIILGISQLVKFPDNFNKERVHTALLIKLLSDFIFYFP